MLTKSFANNCRICLKESIEMRPLTARTNGESIEYWDMLIMLTNLTEIKEFPSHICELCQCTLVTAYSFKKLCLETEQMLSKLSAEPVTEFVSVPNSLPPPEHPDHIDDKIEKTPISSEIKIKINVESPVRLDNDQLNASNRKTKIRKRNGKNDFRKGGVRCCMCEIDFATRKEYQKHYNTVHSEKSLCVLCGKLLSRRMMDMHMVTHSKAQDYMCTECGQRFTLPENLKSHLRIHSGEKHYECEECGIKFMHWNTKNNHIQKVHKMEKFQCNICSKSFTTRSNRARHLRWHKGDFRYTCPHCPMKFIEGQKLRRHLKVHVKKEGKIPGCSV